MNAEETTTHTAIHEIQRKILLADADSMFDIDSDIHQVIIDVLKVAERAANEAIREGAASVTLMYSNIPHSVNNPEGEIGRVVAIGQRKCPTT